MQTVVCTENACNSKVLAPSVCSLDALSGAATTAERCCARHCIAYTSILTSVLCSFIRAPPPHARTQARRNTHRA